MPVGSIILMPESKDECAQDRRHGGIATPLFACRCFLVLRATPLFACRLWSDHYKKWSWGKGILSQIYLKKFLENLSKSFLKKFLKSFLKSSEEEFQVVSGRFFLFSTNMVINAPFRKFIARTRNHRSLALSPNSTFCMISL